MQYGITMVCREKKMGKEALKEVAASIGVFFKKNNDGGRDKWCISEREYKRLCKAVMRYKKYKNSKGDKYVELW